MINSDEWGKFTVCGLEDLESRLQNMALVIARRFEPYYVKGNLKCLILLGGYGRGEGGVIVHNGMEDPHNNFDLLLIAGREFEKQAKLIIKELSEELSFDLNMSVMPVSKLKKLSPRIIWFDMFNGHKILVGSDKYLARFNNFKISDIPAWDFRDLMINRGTLLVINKLILNSGKGYLVRDILIRHVMKSIIGYGDAILYFHGKYSSSYVSKLETMKELSVVREQFRKLYCTAVEFRYKSDYSIFQDKNIEKWMNEIACILESIFLDLESRRLGTELTWDNYLEFFYTHELRQAKSLKDWLKKIRNVFKTKIRFDDDKSLAEKLEIKSGGDHALCAAFYPFVAFSIKSSAYKDFLGDFFEMEDAVKSYLKLWLSVTDSSLPSNLAECGIEL